MYYYMHPAGIFGGAILMILLIIIIIGLILWFASGGRMRRYHRDDYFRDHERSRALDILKERYAKGEINKEEYEAKKKDLG